MKIPKKLKIGGHNYKVIYQEHPDMEGEGGLTDYKTQTIWIDPSFPKTEQEVILIHEILHVINSKFTEEFVEGLAEQLYQVLKDNKLINP